ncbi:MAG: zinc ribbon domain-containing protein [Anaerolineales bacterium]
MPFYDYTCLACHQRFDIFMPFSEYGTRPVTCPHCKSPSVRRGIPRVRVAKSDDSRMEALSSDFSDPSALAGLENDPQAMARMMRKMGSEMGEEMPPEFGEVVDRLEKGQSPDEIEKELPDLGGAADGMMTDEG